MNKKITLEERKKIQLEMLLEIDSFCRSHNIKYMLAFGTLLGAVRHKGFIPWDDDVDICMPLEDMVRFKNEFKSDTLKYSDVDTEPHFEFDFPRITYTPTYSKSGICCRSYGINIDVYPIIEVSSSMVHNRKIIRKIRPVYNLRRKMIRLRDIMIRLLPISTIIGFKYVIRKYRDMTFNLLAYKNGGRFHCSAGPLDQFELHTFNFNPVEDLIEVDFEGYKFLAPAKYHEFLTHRYGDYMQLPPEDQRHPYHGGEYYWK